MTWTDPSLWVGAYAVAGLVSVAVLAAATRDGLADARRELGRRGTGWRAAVGVGLAAVVAFTCWPLLLLAAALGLAKGEDEED